MMKNNSMRIIPADLKPFQGNVPWCDDKWCTNKGRVPATGTEFSPCSDINTLLKVQRETGGVTGRGVTPCPFGYLEKMQLDGSRAVTPVTPDNIRGKRMETANLMDPGRPAYLPPQGEFRPLMNIGNDWRN